MDVKNIVTFLDVADTRSFSISAANLKITQPAVSKRVATLEEQLSTRLFDRLGRRVLLTEAAEVLLPSARKIVSEIDRVESQLCQLGKTVAGHLGLVSSPHVAATYLPEFLKQFSAQFPDVEVSLEVKHSPELIEDVEHGLFEIGLCELSNTHASETSSEQIWREKLNIVVAPQHPLAGLHAVSAEELTSYPAILPPVSTTSRTLISEALAVSGYKEKNATIVPNFSALAKMVEIGLGWGILPQPMCTSPKLVVLSTSGLELDLCTYLIHHRSLTLSKAATAFSRALPHSIDAGNSTL
jgi:DNA-binding transcriptional LysR family regulator